MRLLIVLIFLISSISFATSVSVEIPLETPREVNDLVGVIFGEDSAEDDNVEELRHLAVGVQVEEPEAVVARQRGEINTQEGVHVEWDIGGQGDRFVRFRIGDRFPETTVPIDVGEILAGDHILGSPFFYFVVKALNGQRALYLFDLRGVFILVRNFGDVDFEVVTTGLFENKPEQPFIVIKQHDNLRAFAWRDEQAVPILCPDLEDGMTVLRVGRVPKTQPPQTYWLVKIGEEHRLFYDTEETTLNASPRALQPTVVAKSAVATKEKKRFTFRWRKRDNK